MKKLKKNTALLKKKKKKDKLRLRSFNSQLQSALSVVGYHDGGQEIGKYCPFPEIARSRSKKSIKVIIAHPCKDERNSISITTRRVNSTQLIAHKV